LARSGTANRTRACRRSCPSVAPTGVGCPGCSLVARPAAQRDMMVHGRSRVPITCHHVLAPLRGRAGGRRCDLRGATRRTVAMQPTRPSRAARTSPARRHHRRYGVRGHPSVPPPSGRRIAAGDSDRERRRAHSDRSARRCHTPAIAVAHRRRFVRSVLRGRPTRDQMVRAHGGPRDPPSAGRPDSARVDCAPALDTPCEDPRHTRAAYGRHAGWSAGQGIHLRAEDPSTPVRSDRVHPYVASTVANPPHATRLHSVNDNFPARISREDTVSGVNSHAGSGWTSPLSGTLGPAFWSARRTLGPPWRAKRPLCSASPPWLPTRRSSSGQPAAVGRVLGQGGRRPSSGGPRTDERAHQSTHPRRNGGLAQGFQHPLAVVEQGLKAVPFAPATWPRGQNRVLQGARDWIARLGWTAPLLVRERFEDLGRV